ncbi:DNA polymerase-4 [Cyclonatronum proteinivorum]|uniref:DNA polymerase-4 n=1 Tax=Cyclonatronum proteinivorum TaxID=1457365 RepID=A0A345UIE6_9BACT|nr:DNA polymerase IV [Cyclonatronum proteinivorum]AXJ00248.1 DNA polymerase-4 [Cyclonatronum proteinivorum]
MDTLNPGAYDLTRNVHRITLYNTISAEQRHRRNKPRLYLHLDMNCFYAQVEQVSYDLQGLPLVVGGWRKPDGTPRGIVATSSYEARKFGVKTGMSAFEAVQLCPYVVFMQVHYEKYQAISKQIREVLDRYAADVEGYSMDEYFLDLTFMIGHTEDELRRFGQRIKRELYEATALFCSVGIARSKTYAKLASDLVKPNGLTLVLDEAAERQLIHPLQLDEVWGIGSRRFARLEQAGLRTIGEAIAKGRGPFQKLFGAYFGRMLWETVCGLDRAIVADPPAHVPEEVTYMHTFSQWTTDPEAVRGEIIKSVRQLCYRMRGYNRRARRFSSYLRFQDESWRGVQIVFATAGLTNLDDYVTRTALQALMPVVQHYLRHGQRIRGFGISTLDLDASGQLELFFREDEKLRNLFRARDTVNNRYGFESLVIASSFDDVKGKTHFLDRS